MPASSILTQRALEHLVLLACLAGVLNFSFPGVPPGGNATLSPEVQAKAKENFKKRFADFGAKKDRKTLRRNHSFLIQRRAPP